MCTRHWIFVYQVQTLEELIYVEANLNLIFPWQISPCMQIQIHFSPHMQIQIQCKYIF